MINKMHTPLLLGAAFVSATLSAAFMSSTLYAMAPAGWMSFAAIALGLVLEIFKSGFSRLSADLWNERRYVGLLFSGAFSLVVLVFAIWAGQERFLHDLTADERKGVALREVRLDQIKQELAMASTELEQLASRVDVVADTGTEKARLDALYAQSAEMRKRMALSKAEELERSSIAAVRAEIQRKEAEASGINRQAFEYRQSRESALRTKIADLHAEEVGIASRESKLASTSLEGASLVIKAVIVLIETAPAFLFFLYGSRGGVHSQAPAPVEPQPVAKTTAVDPTPEVAQAVASKANEALTPAPELSPQVAIVATVAPVAPVAPEYTFVAPVAPVAAAVVAPTLPVAPELAPEAHYLAPEAEEPLQLAPELIVIEEPCAPAVEIAPNARPTHADTAACEATVKMDADPIPVHPKLPEALEYVSGLAIGERISTDSFGRQLVVGNNSVSQLLRQLADHGLVEKQGRAWVRV